MSTLQRLSAGALGALIGATTATAAPPATTLPTPCTATNCTAQGGPNKFVTLGTATAVVNANTLQVNQSSASAVLNWSNFDIGSGGQVVFKQPSGSSVALNRIFEANPSQIFGSLSSNGQIYLINQNGFLFGSGSSVNVGGLIASSLGISDTTFQNGLLSAITLSEPALSYTPPAGGGPLTSAVTVQSGATMTTNGAGERILLAAPTVSNAGTITAADGQVILASGQSVYLYASTDPGLRGLLVEVDGGGTTTNEVSGNISAPRGDVTLIGLAVNQNGRVSATTSTSANGSIQLLARDSSNPSIPPGTSTPTFLSQPGGTLELGPQSVTEVLPDPTDHSQVVDAQVQLQSTLTFAGAHVTFAGGSQVNAPDGALTVTAAADFADPDFSNTGDPSIRMDSGASIDLAGSVATVPITRNLVTVELRGTELANDPLQRNGPLRGQTIVVDARADGGLGTPLADVSGEIALITRGIQERTDQGGTVTFSSAGDIGIAKGATINVSGGEVNYTGGIMQTTQLVEPDGALVDIGQASPNQAYVGILNPTFEEESNKWGVIGFVPTPGIAHYEPGYVQGANAGTVQFEAPNMVLEGTFLGSAVNGPMQRTPSTMALGGTFIVGSPGGAGAAADDFRAPSVVFTASNPNIAFSDSAPLPNAPLYLSTDITASGGFTQLEVLSNSRITLPFGTPLSLAAGGTLTLMAPRLDVDSSITTPGGSVALTTVTSASPTPGLAPGIFVGDGVTIDVSGNWTNDSLLPLGSVPTGTVALNGGSVSIEQVNSGGALDFGSNVGIRANGGGWLGQSDTFSGGAGGSIALINTAVNSNGEGTLAFGSNFAVEGFGVQGAKGGSLTLDAPRIAIANGGSDWLPAQTVSADPTTGDVLNIGATLFRDFGFSSFDLTANGAPLATGGAPSAANSTLTVAPNTYVDLNVLTLLPASDSRAEATGAQILDFAQPTLLPAYQRIPASLSLNAIPGSPNSYSQVGDLLVGAGATFAGAPLSSLSISAQGSILFDGVAQLPGGSVALSLLTPSPVIDPGFVEGQRIELGPTADIDVAGTVVYTPNDANQLLGTLYAGGTVSLIAQRGFVETDPGSTIDFAGTQAQFDQQAAGAPPALTTLASAGGTLSVGAPEAISLLGSFDGAGGTGSLGKALAGSLNVELTQQPILFTGDGLSYPTAPLTIEVVPGAPTVVADTSGVAVLSARQIAASGIGSLSLLADGAIEFNQGVTLSLSQSLVLHSPALSIGDGSSVSVSAPYIAIGTGTNAQTGPLQAVAPTPGSGVLNIHGDQVDVVGYLAFQGLSTANISSSGDISLRGNELNTTANDGSIAIAGNLTLAAERVYPDTDTTFTITAVDSTPGGTPYSVHFEQTGASPGTPLSVDGSLTVNADNIVQAGTVLAPFGSIALNANPTTGSLTLASGSVTSVSGDGALIPYGILENGTVWEYGLTPSTIASVTGIPNREVTLSGNSVTLAKGATVDIAGGGDLYSYQWTPGTGGTVDSLANGSIPGLYAIVPAMAGQFAPYDPLMYAGSSLQPGESVYLSGGAGVPAGVYALLPARYALLPGAYLVQAISGFSSGNLKPGATTQAPDGGTVVAGYLTDTGSGAGAGTGYSGFEIRPGSYSYTLADYTLETGTSFFSSAAQASSAPAAPVSLPADAGALSISVSQTLNALGTVLANGAPGGQNGTIGVAASQIEIDGSGGTAGASGGVVLASSVLSGWNAGRLIIGGTPLAPGVVQVASTNVDVASGADLVANEVVLVATQGVSVASGATIESTSLAKNSTPDSAALANPVTLTLVGSGPNGTGASGAALLAVSDLDNYTVVRTTETPATEGTLNIAAGATVGSRGALLVDVPGTAQIGDGTLSGAGAQWSLNGTQVVFGAQGSGAPGSMTIDPSLVAALNSGSSVAIRGSSSIDIDEAVSLGTSGGKTPLTSITLNAPVINNVAGAGSASFSAGTIILGAGTTAATPATPLANAGSVTFSADEIDLGPGTMSLNGFAETNLVATSAVVGVGDGGLGASGAMEVRTPLLTTASGATTTLGAAGDVLLDPAQAAATTAAITPGIGGSLAITSGGSLLDEARILMPSGEVSLTAASQLTLQSGASIDVAGIVPTFAHSSTGTPGGSITLDSAGNLSVSGDSTLNVSAAPGAGAGQINVTGAGAVDLAGALHGNAQAGQMGGSFTLEAGSLDNFNALSAGLQQGGFTTTQDIRVNTGDLVLNSGSTMTAQNVALTADTGSVIVDGTINATSSGGSRGIIELAAGNDVTIAGQLLANAGDSMSPGGYIQLSTVSGTVALEAGSTISATSASGTGELLIRAPAAASGTDINLEINTSLSQVDTAVIEPIWSEALPSGTVSAAAVAQVMNDAANFMSAVTPNLLARIPELNDANVVLRPFVDMTSTGSLELPSIDFSAYRFDGQPADVAVRAAGDLTVSGTLSDGFVTVSAPGLSYVDLAPCTAGSVCASSSFTLVAGADFTSANTAATVAGLAADLILSGGSIIRTGTGDITLAAARDIDIGDTSTGQGASIYTGGSQIAPSIPGTRTKAPTSYGAGDSLITLVAGSDVVGVPVSQAVTAWQPRGIYTPADPGVASSATWGNDFSAFGWSVGALGGGQVSIEAGGDAENVSAAVADVSYVDGNGVSHTQGGGNLSLLTGGNVGSAYLYVADGIGRIQAGGAVDSGRSDPATQLALGSLLIAGDASFFVNARGDVLLQGITEASDENAAGHTVAGTPIFFRYGADSELSVTSTGGGVTLNSDGNSGLSDFVGRGVSDQFVTTDVVPGTVELAAYNGDVNLSGIMTLFPSARGELSVVASNDIVGNFQTVITMADVLPSTLPSANSLLTTAQTLDVLQPLGLLADAAQSSIHAGDAVPVLIAAGNDITNLQLAVPKAATIIAGQDINGLVFNGQNLAPTDITQIVAGGSISYTSDPTSADFNPTAHITLSGPGELEIIAGGDIDLGFSAGVTTVGNLVNPNLSAQGANVLMLAGLGAPVSAANFVDDIIKPSSAYESQLTSYVDTLTGGTPQSYAAAASEFLDMPLADQLPLLTSVFFNELTLSGREANDTPSLGFTRGYTAIDDLFPGSRNSGSPYAGDLTLELSRIYTLQGGSISLLLPGGDVNVGLALLPPDLAQFGLTRGAADLGIVAVQSGDVQIYSLGSTEVNSSRVFTEGGGNIIIWSTLGNIDAGNGAKTSVSAPPPEALVSANGTITLDFSNTIAGSGIRTISTGTDITAGDVDLDAPVGFVNAGDAGIGAAGNLNIAAQRVLGVDNIQVGGTATGVPPQVSGIGASLLGASGAASSTSTASSNTEAEGEAGASKAPLSQAAMSWLDVFVQGFGEETCSAGDVECLKRQKPSNPQ